MRAAVDARDEGADILVLARTDAAASLGAEEAVERCVQFRALGADITHVAGLRSEEELRRYCAAVDGPKMHNNNSAALGAPTADRTRGLPLTFSLRPCPAPRPRLAACCA